MPVGFIGLGNLGAAMARRLLDTGVDLLVWNRTLSKAEALSAPVAASPAALADRCDLIILNLFDSEAVRDVLARPDGILACKRDGLTLLDTTTNHFRAVLDLHTLCIANNLNYVEAPVFGSVVPASLGKLTIVVSGDSTGREITRPILEMLGENIFYLPAPGLATRMKLVNNLVLGSFMATIAEAVALGESCGIERGRVLEILGAGAGNSSVLRAKEGKLRNLDFSPHFAVNAIAKDLRYLNELTAELAIHSELGPVAGKIFASGVTSGLGDEDFSAIFKLMGARD